MAQDKSIIQEYESDDELAPSIEELDNKNDKAIIDELSKYSKDKIEIVKELHREKAIEVLKMRGE